MFDYKRLNEAVKAENGISRRLFLSYGAALSTLPLLGRASWANPSPVFQKDPFSLGVASGDPDSTSVILWTRLAPEPLQPHGGLGPQPIEVKWELAEDEGFQKLVASGTAQATPQLGHSVHVEAKGLKPDHWYWYRFQAGDAVSPVGRTRTMPETTAMPDQLKFAFASCQNYEQGLFTAYEQMAQDDLDLVFHLGDYIYEYQSGRNGKIRTHFGPEIESLGDYRIRHSQYRADPLLHNMHAKCPWFVTWDDHEFDNNCAADVSEELDADPIDYLLRRANAYQAYYEMMPLRPGCLPQGPHMQLYRQGGFGRLTDFFVLDTRQYRSDQPNGDKKSPLNQSAMACSNSLLGGKQRNWLQSQLISSDATWNVLAQQVMMGMVSFSSKDEERVYSMDQWPGSAYERMQLLQFMADRRVPNPVVLTGDIHSNWVNNLRVDDRKPETPVVATEFVGTSISSGGNGVEKRKGHADILSHNPCVQFQNSERGYVRCTVTPKNWTSEYMVVDDVTRPGGHVTPRAAFVVEAGTPGAQPA
ncbi:alkaline phosphatase D family protein [Gimesia chilikensis]|uniref:alkaline phosphatase D family protein n=1 Tax=Gimesia chilikensis TaxID=2605989 RepID=UPI00118D12BF|nr:alkaline phosphatase D family protein [Gimesia chilikensis]QDT87501.1 Alkaline phosphatase D precursor [Gimesia chilikensis]